MSPWLTYGLLGAVAGPFVAVLGDSITRGVPLSWIVVSRSAWMPMLASSALLSFALVLVVERRPTSAGAVSWLVIVGLLLSVIDWGCHRLPQPIVAALLGGGVVQFGLTGLVERDTGPLLRAGAAAVVVLAIALTFSWVTPSGLGFGDVTLSATIAFFLGWFSWWHVFAGLTLGLMLGTVTFGVLRVGRRYHRGLMIPLGPALVFAPVCTILLM
ncbi:prepilin peptidase [Lentzea sp. E54]|uniref:prepilin peptidase n=1 Tax=Lentzea xerophila TaxID=3435883 RepID=UPI003DA230E1